MRGGDLSWPLDSPVSSGIALCFFLVFAIGFVFSVNPKLITRRKVMTRSVLRREKLSGRMAMYIFGPLLLVTLLFSWNRSNDARYEWLNRDD